MATVAELEDYKQALAGTRPQPRRWETAGTGEGVIMVSNDSHVGPPLEAFRPYCPNDLLEEFDDFATSFQQSSSMGGGGKYIEAAKEVSGGTAEMLEALQAIVGDPTLRGDPSVRLAHMDEDGIAAEVVFHGQQDAADIPFVPGGLTAKTWEQGPRAAELTAAGLRIYNRWLIDYCSTAPERHIGMAYLPMWDVELAVQEAEFAREHGLRGINFPSPRPGLAPYNDPQWDPLWSASASLAMPLDSHIANTMAQFDVFDYHGIGAGEMLLQDLYYFSRRSVPMMIFGGVFERHPGLKLVMTEGATYWIPEMVRELDSYSPEYSERYKARSHLSKKPSEYLWSNISIGASFMSNSEARGAVADGTVDNVMWGRDYPHPEGTWPYTRFSVRNTMEGVPADAVLKMLGLNAFDVFDLDRAALQTVANRIAPVLEEVMTPLAPDELPAGRRFTAGFRPPGQGLL